MTQEHYTKETPIVITDNEASLSSEFLKRLYYPEYNEILSWWMGGMGKRDLQMALIGLMRKGLIVRKGTQFCVIYNLGAAYAHHSEHR